MDSDEPVYEPSDDLEDDGVLDAADTLLEDDPRADPLDTGIIPPDRWSAAERFGTTLEEEREGESLDDLLAEEEPDRQPDNEDWVAPPVADALDRDVSEAADEDGLLLDDEPAPRAGRLVAADEGAHGDTEPDLTARDVGIDAGAASAEEAAVHVTDEDEDVDL